MEIVLTQGQVNSVTDGFHAALKAARLQVTACLSKTHAQSLGLDNVLVTRQYGQSDYFLESADWLVSGKELTQKELDAISYNDVQEIGVEECD